MKEIISTCEWKSSVHISNHRNGNTVLDQKKAKDLYEVGYKGSHAR